MAKKPRKEIVLAQNFLRCSKFARSLIRTGSIGPRDIVYEIGAGRGMITAELARIARRVVALEIDPELVQDLRNRFRGAANVQILEADYLAYPIAEQEYKIFANIPYNRTADIVRKILHARPAPREACLVMQREAAEKFSGSPKETRFSILAKPWFQLEIVRTLRREDFYPVPGVDSVLLRIRRRARPLLAGGDGPLYRGFVAFGFGEWKRCLKATFRRVFSHGQWKRLSKDLRFDPLAAPSELSFEQWMGLFDGFRQRVPCAKQRVVRERGTKFLGPQMHLQRFTRRKRLKRPRKIRQRQGVADQRGDVDRAVGQPGDRAREGAAQRETADDR
jgi:23S rRNA (adenine-N6)-dimethyltransferase